jgi:hypothetical protein
MRIQEAQQATINGSYASGCGCGSGTLLEGGFRDLLRIRSDPNLSVFLIRLHSFLKQAYKHMGTGTVAKIPLTAFNVH